MAKRKFETGIVLLAMTKELPFGTGQGLCSGDRMPEDQAIVEPPKVLPRAIDCCGRPTPNHRSEYRNVSWKFGPGISLGQVPANVLNRGHCC